MSKKAIVLNCTAPKNDKRYVAPFLVYPNIHLFSRGLAHCLSFMGEDHPEKEKVKRDVAEYNDYLHYLSGLDQFWAFLNEHDLAVTYDQVEERYGKDAADKVFSLSNYVFETDLVISKGVLFVGSHEPKYQATLPDGTVISFTVGSSDDGYPKAAADGRKFLWNWTNDDRDFTYSLWEIFDELNLIPKSDNDEDSDSYDPYALFYFWDQARFETAEPNPNILRCMKILESMGYLKQYALTSEEGQTWFRYRGSKKGIIGLAVLDMAFKKNRLALEKLKLVLNSSEDVVKECPYILTDAKRHQYLSKETATYGGHLKQKIYGRFDCPSANSYIAKGQYVQQRIFFADEKTAVAAGFRPCGTCMKEKYKIWKALQDK